MERQTGYRRVEGTSSTGALRVLSAKDMEKTTVRNAQGEELGTIENMMLDVNAGKVDYVILAYGGVLGVGTKYFAIPWEALTPRPEEKVLVAPISKERLDQAEGIDADNPPMEPNWDLVETARPAAARPAVAPPPLTTPPPTERERAEAPLVAPATATPYEQMTTGRRGELREERVATREEMPPAPTEVVQERGMPATGAGFEHLSAADLQTYLKGMDYPAGKQDLIRHAEGQRAPSSVHEALGQFEDKEYRSAADVSKEFGLVKGPGRMRSTTAAERPREAPREMRTMAEEESLRHVSAAGLQTYLKGMDYPAGKQDLIRHAETNNAPPAVVNSLRRFEDRQYRSATEVSQEFGRIK